MSLLFSCCCHGHLRECVPTIHEASETDMVHSADSLESQFTGHGMEGLNAFLKVFVSLCACFSVSASVCVTDVNVFVSFLLLSFVQCIELLPPCFHWPRASSTHDSSLVHA